MFYLKVWFKKIRISIDNYIRFRCELNSILDSILSFEVANVNIGKHFTPNKIYIIENIDKFNKKLYRKWKIIPDENLYNECILALKKDNECDV